MIELYAKRLEVEPTPGRSPLETFSLAIRSWVGGRWPAAHPWFNLAEQASFRAEDGEIFRWEPFLEDNRALVDFTWRHRDAEAPHISWRTEVTYVQLPGRASIGVRVSNSQIIGEGSSPKLTTRPRLVIEIADRFHATGPEGLLSLQPRYLLESDVAVFARYELTDPERTYPILVVSPTADGKYVVEPNQIAREFVSLAKVVVLTNPDAAFALTHELTRRELSVFRGAARLYGPEFSRDANPRHHPLFLSHRFSLSGTRLSVARVLASLTPQTFRPDPAVPQLRDERAVAVEQSRSRYIERLKTTATVDVVAWQELAQQYADERDGARQRVRELENTIQGLESKVAALQYNLAQRDKEQSAQEAALAVAEFGPSNAREAVEIAAELYSEKITFLPSALDSATASPYRRVSELARVLDVMATISGRMRAGSLGRSLRDEFQSSGIDYRLGIAKSSSKRIRDQFRFSDGQTEFNCEEHIALGAGTYSPEDCLRIYFESTASAGLVVGHVGRHLDTDHTS